MERFQIIHLGNAYDFVVKDHNTNRTYGTFQGDDDSLNDLLEDLAKENNELKIHILQQQKHAKRLENENIQMYTTIKESYKSERTQLGKNTLRQLAEALKVELE